MMRWVLVAVEMSLRGPLELRVKGALLDWRREKCIFHRATIVSRGGRSRLWKGQNRCLEEVNRLVIHYQ